METADARRIVGGFVHLYEADAPCRRKPDIKAFHRIFPLLFTFLNLLCQDAMIRTL
jgi:hypothetical protein